MSRSEAGLTLQVMVAKNPAAFQEEIAAQAEAEYK
jgi:hypothetical protein